MISDFLLIKHELKNFLNKEKIYDSVHVFIDLIKNLDVIV